MGNSIPHRISTYIRDAEENNHLDLTEAKDAVIENFPWEDFLARDSMQRLRRVDLVNCKLKSLPPLFPTLRMLEVLRFADNKISQLPTELFDCVTLQVLNFNANCVQEIPEDISKLTNLTELQFSGNEIKVLPTGIEALRQLKTLNVDKNYIDFSTLTDRMTLVLTAVGGQYHNQRSPQEILPGYAPEF